ncbi:MAG TPA: SWIM zinc finger family protein [Azospirillum sp.]
MAYGYGGWAPYVPVAERRRQAALEVAKLRKKGQPVSPVVIEGRAIASTFWGKAWCDNLESYRDYESRLPRGRTYVRNGSVIDLQIAPLEIKALVSGSEIYKVGISIKALPAPQWQSLCKECAGGIDSLVELLQGRFSKAVMERLCRQDKGLFPKPSEIHFSCSCPDGAWMCKHVAAVLYGVGARLDTQPELLFRLRAVDEKDLVAVPDAAVPLSATAPDAGKVLEDEDLSALFGLDMAIEENPPLPAAKPPAKTKAKAPPDNPPPRRRKHGAVWDPTDIDWS